MALRERQLYSIFGPFFGCASILSAEAQSGMQLGPARLLGVVIGAP